MEEAEGVTVMVCKIDEEPTTKVADPLIVPKRLVLWWIPPIALKPSR